MAQLAKKCVVGCLLSIGTYFLNILNIFYYPDPDPGSGSAMRLLPESGSAKKRKKKKKKKKKTSADPKHCFSLS
jgi:hypothetical protein